MDEFNLSRFIEAQADSYAAALAEIQRGAKRSHWMWFIFPQLAALGRSTTAKFFGLGGLAEARAYLAHPILGARYLECVSALQDLATSDPVAVFGEVDAMKLRSSLTLFEAARPMLLLGAALDRWFAGVEDPETLALLQRARPSAAA
ncbi:DUF1810 domain-containing protein [Sphingomonas sp. MG17]|uniref:DUF1810 domain-containing protein n=1 Tax=Sphingomonas tagetis TaxID=2949092 RepID=A0A9X2HKI6_9SPHN|nr:DUF1810 domain-containing protein [Sphingomonas tagetis]MCP3730341.1 DUF1810 domain-containing protein [Sphingomonas tagetis]